MFESNQSCFPRYSEQVQNPCSPSEACFASSLSTLSVQIFFQLRRGMTFATRQGLTAVSSGKAL